MKYQKVDNLVESDRVVQLDEEIYLSPSLTLQRGNGDVT